MDSGAMRNEPVPDIDLDDEERLVDSNLPGDSPDQVVDSDSKLLHSSDTSSLSAHNQQYTKLLEEYVRNFVNNSEDKKNNKADMFKIAKRLLFWMPTSTIAITVLTIVAVASDKITATEAIPGLVTALGTVAGTFMVIPQMITGYLFNEKEEEHLAEMIGKIQDYDRDIRGGL